MKNEQAYPTIPRYYLSCPCYERLWTESIFHFHLCAVHTNKDAAHANAGSHFHLYTAHTHVGAVYANAASHCHPCTIHADIGAAYANAVSHTPPHTGRGADHRLLSRQRDRGRPRGDYHLRMAV
jgi:hypothetical protein